MTAQPHAIATPAVALRAVAKTYDQGTAPVHALRGITLEIAAGQFVAVMGASGSGKSTLLHLCAGLTTPSSGEVALFGQQIGALDDDALTLLRRRAVGLIFQAFNLMPTMSALENVALPLMIAGEPLRAAAPKAERLLRQVGLGDRLHHRPDELSGGQQQRVAIARALINEAPLLLADEPTGNLDSAAGEEVLHLLRELTVEGRRTVVMVTHDPRSAAYADRVVTLRDGQVIDELHSPTPRADALIAG
jgi:putative ABC transport system ATP-binding protein